MFQKLKGYHKNWIFHQLQTIEDLYAFARWKGYKPGWVWFQLNRNGWKPKGTEERKQEFTQWLESKKVEEL